jgi:hypothetical protein
VSKLDFEEAWNDQKKFLRMSMNWMDATVKKATSKEEKIEALAKKRALKIVLERMKDTEEMLID